MQLWALQWRQIATGKSDYEGHAFMEWTAVRSREANFSAGSAEVGNDAANKQDAPSWESVHVCPNCGHVINLAELDLTAITTGIVTCPSCDWSGQIEIQIIDQVPRKKPVRRGFASPKINEFGRVRQEEFPGTTFSLDGIPSNRYGTN
jgi:hypothetical protein